MSKQSELAVIEFDSEPRCVAFQQRDGTVSSEDYCTP